MFKNLYTIDVQKFVYYKFYFILNLEFKGVC
jgi:hypothetical protein